MKEQHDNTYAVKHLLDDLPESPCDACDHWLQCKHERIACADFNAFIQSGIIYRDRSNRSPVKRIFNKIYKDSIDAKIKPRNGTKNKQGTKKRILRRWGILHDAT
jgi:hypothetical protein